MVDHKTGMLDDIGDDSAPASEPVADAAPAPEPDAGPQPDADAAPAEPADPKPKPSEHRPEGFVTKQERDRLATELQEARQQRALYEDRFNKVIERYFSQAQPKADAAPAEAPQDPGPPPNAKDSPYDWAVWRQQKDAFDDYQRDQQRQHFEQQTQAERQWQQAYGEMYGQFQSAAREQPELTSLYEGLRGSYANEYAAYGYTVPQIAQLVEKQEAQIIQWAYANRVPIADVVKNLATARGIQAKAPAPAADAQQQQQRPRDPATGQFLPSEAEKAAKAKESQERNASLSAAPGAPVKKMTGAELAKMSEEDMWRHFESVGRKPGFKQFEREMGFRS